MVLGRAAIAGLGITEMGKVYGRTPSDLAGDAIALALTDAGLEIPEWLRTGASAPPAPPQPPGDVEPSASGADPESEHKGELDAQKAEADDG